MLARLGWDDYTFAFHDGDKIGPVMLGRIAKKTGLKPSDLLRVLEIYGRLAIMQKPRLGI